MNVGGISPSLSFADFKIGAKLMILEAYGYEAGVDVLKPRSLESPVTLVG